MTINIDDLTIGQLKQIQAMTYGANQSTIQRNLKLLDGMIGKYVIVRSRNEGINAGFVKMADETGVILIDARRIYFHAPKDKSLSWYEGVAVSGLSSNSKISGIVPEKAIIEDYSITVCSDDGAKSIQEFKANAQG